MDIEALLNKGRSKNSLLPQKVKKKTDTSDAVDAAPLSPVSAVPVSANVGLLEESQQSSDVQNLNVAIKVDETPSLVDQQLEGNQISEEPVLARKGASSQIEIAEDLNPRITSSLSVDSLARLLDYLAKSEYGLRDLRVAMHLVARSSREGIEFLPYTNREIEESTMCHFSHVSTSMNRLEKYGFIERTKPKLSTVKKSFRIIW